MEKEAKQETDLMEKAGTGIMRVKSACSHNKNKVLFDFTDSFWITINTNKKQINADKVTDNQKKILISIKNNPFVTTIEMSKDIKISQRKIKENIRKLKELNLLRRIGSPKKGHWEILEYDSGRQKNDER